MKTAEFWIDILGLARHPEGGWYREIYRSGEEIPQAVLPDGFQGDRPCSTSIYFLIRGGDVSRFHRLKSDELWHFYEGSPLTLHMIEPAGDYSSVLLGRDAEKGQVFQAVVRAGVWFGAAVEDPSSYSLVGCVMAPGFDFRDFELGDRGELLRLFPRHKEIIEKLTDAGSEI